MNCGICGKDVDSTELGATINGVTHCEACEESWLIHEDAMDRLVKEAEKRGEYNTPNPS